MSRAVDRDALLQPVLADARHGPTGYQPWRLQSQVYVALFGGGALGTGLIAFGNAVMLGMSTRARWMIVAVALLGEIPLVIAAALTKPGVVQLANPAAGLIVFGGVYLLQRRPDRVYHFHSDEDEPYASLFGAGLLVCILGRVVDVSIAYAVM
jgi:hypothetical protein